MMNAAEVSEKKSTTTHRKIRKAAILGSGVMGSRIAMHFANIGVQAVLLDIVPFNLDDKDKNNPKMRNKIVNDAFAAALKSSPSPVYHAKVAEKVTLGNFDDNLNLIADCDFIIEAVVERLDIKQSLYEKVEKFRKPGTIIASNTSGIPMNMLIEGRSEDFQKNFCGVHFFNPPRYLRLLEIIPGPKTDPAVVDFLMKYGDLYLGKETVLCKDTPAFIANRVGIYGIMSALHTVEKMGLSVSEVDKLTGPVIGRPKSATFRTLDVVGLDTAIKVAKGLYDNCPKDESKAKFALPKIVSELEKNGWFGDKTKQGYYKMTKDGGKKQLFELNLKTFEYEPEKKAKFDVFEKTKEIDNLKNRFAVLLADEGKAGEFYRATFYDMFRYVSFRIPEISDELYRIDKAICAGFGWELGPFVTWDALGVRETTAKMEAAGEKPAQWVYDMLAGGNESFYKVENGTTKYYDIPSKSYRSIPGTEGFIILDNLRSTKKVWGNAGASIFDLGDGVLGLEYHTKMNAIGQEIIEGIHHAVNLAEKSYRGLVIGNDSPQFSAGANLGMVYMFAAEQEFDELDLMVRQFQQTMMRLRYSAIPVVGAPSGLALGGGCETLLHCDKVVAHAESYVGLVEVGVGLIPAGGGTKEMILRASDTYRKDDTEVNRLGESFMNIATAKVATSAHEAVNLGYFRDSDRIVINRARLLSEAKTAVLEIDEKGYTQPMKRKDIKVLGKTALANFTAGATGMLFGHYISEHDLKIAKKLAYVMAGGDLDAPAMVSEDYLLDLEREAFLSLCGEKKTLERIHSILFSGKPLRN